MSRKPVPAQAGDRARLEILFDRPQLLGRLFGEYDQNLVAIENRLGVYVSARGNRVQIEGEAESAARAREVLTGLYNRIVKGEDIDSGMVEAVISMSSEPTLDGIIRQDVAEGPSIMIRTRKKTIVPRSATQTRYMHALASSDVIFALGPAGTGKTYVAVAQAVQIVTMGNVQARDGSIVRIAADTLCVHGDRTDAGTFARRLRQALEDAAVVVAALD